MYLEHFGLDEPPFRITPHTDFFFDGADRGTTLDALVYAVLHDEGIVKVSGEVGSGKTMLCRVLLERLPETVETVYLANPSLTRDELLHSIADELQMKLTNDGTRVVMRELFEHLINLYAVSNTATGSANNFTVAHNSATTPWSIASTPTDLAVCVSWVSTTYPCGTAMPSTANTVIAGNTAVAVIWSQGKNFGSRAGGGVANGGAGVDEIANNKHRLPAPTAQSTHGIFVYHPPTPASTGNEFDDQMVWLPVGVLYSRMIAAGILP